MTNPSPRKRIKKSTWLPILLTLYFIGMAGYFGTQLLRNGEIGRFVTVCAVEVILIVLCYIFYKKREKF